MNWHLQEAKNRLSEVVKVAKDKGPQIITVRGKEEVAVVSIAELRKLRKQEVALGTDSWDMVRRPIRQSKITRCRS